MRFLILGLCLFMSALFGNEPMGGVKRQMLKDLDFIHQVFAIKYAPAEWKKQHFGIDIDTVFAHAREDIQRKEKVTTQDFQRLLHTLFKQISDYHVDIYFYSTEASSLPFFVESAIDRQGIRRYFVVASLPLSPLQEGDEIVTWEGQPIDYSVQKLGQQECGHPNPCETDQRLAELMLTQRLGALGHRVPQGEVALGVRYKGLKEVRPLTVKWAYTAEKIADRAKFVTPKCQMAVKEKSSSLTSLFQKRMVKAHWRGMFSSTHELGERESYLPALGRKLWTTPEECPFDAYLFKIPSGRRVGYVRIPHYMGDALEVEAFSEIITNLQDKSDMLVIDQLNNPGGSLFYAYGLLSTLAPYPLEIPKQRLMLTQAEVYTTLELSSCLEYVTSIEEAQQILGETIGGYPLTSMQMVESLQQFNQAVVASWDRGQTYTDPLYLFGFDKIMPHPHGVYDKPIFVLINPLDFSCGDLFPAILQDNQRALLVGTRTAGAGGYVEDTAYPNQQGILRFSTTASMVERTTNMPLENLGVTPDIALPVTVNDLQNNYKEYVHALVHLLENWPIDETDISRT